MQMSNLWLEEIASVNSYHLDTERTQHSEAEWSEETTGTSSRTLRGVWITAQSSGFYFCLYNSPYSFIPSFPSDDNLGQIECPFYIIIFTANEHLFFYSHNLGHKKYEYLPIKIQVHPSSPEGLWRSQCLDISMLSLNSLSAGYCDTVKGSGWDPVFKMLII